MNRSRDAWSFYWAQGNATSLPDLFPRNYDGSLLEFWEKTFECLRPGARVLDICTGNGAIALLAYEYALRSKLPCRIDGVDRADIRPPAPVTPADCQVTLAFTPRTRAEHLPFPTASIDLVIGQFALEYCDTAAVLPELRRVLKDGGRVAFMLHHADSLTVKSAAEFVAIGEALLQAPTIFLRLQKCLSNSTPRSAGKSAVRERALKQLQAGLLNLDDLTRRYHDNRILGALAQRLTDLAGRVRDPGSNVAEEIAELQERLVLHVRRARDLLEAAHDRSRIQSLTAVMGAQGWQEISVNPGHFDGTLLAWELRART